LWSIAKALRIPVDSNVQELTDLPYTISFVIRKRQQVDNFYELPKEKRPPDKMIWDGDSDELEEWLDRVFSGSKEPEGLNLVISDVEG